MRCGRSSWIFKRKAEKASGKFKGAHSKKPIILSGPWNVRKIMKQNHKKMQGHFKYSQGQASFDRHFVMHVYIIEETNLFTSNFCSWFHNFEQLCQLVYLYYDSVTHAQFEYLERRFWKKTTLVQKKFMFWEVFQSGENYTDQIRLSFRDSFGQFTEAK